MSLSRSVIQIEQSCNKQANMATMVILLQVVVFSEMRPIDGYVLRGDFATEESWLCGRNPI